jgi:hypothetical protein
MLDPNDIEKPTRGGQRDVFVVQLSLSMSSARILEQEMNEDLALFFNHALIIFLPLI